MKRFILPSMLLTIFVACTPKTPENQIKSEFKTYVFENFGNPDDFIEVVKVEVVDTVSTENSKEEVRKLLETNDDIEKETDSLSTYYGDKLTNLTKNLNRYAGLRGDEKALRLLVAAYESAEENMDFFSSAKAARYGIARERVEEALAVEDSVFIIQYKIRVRMIKQSEPVVCDYYCLSDNTGIRFYDRSIVIDDYPESIKTLYESMSKLADESKIRQEYKLKNISANRDFIQYLETWAD